MDLVLQDGCGRILRVQNVHVAVFVMRSIVCLLQKSGHVDVRGLIFLRCYIITGSIHRDLEASRLR